MIGGYRKNNESINDSLKDLLGTWDEHYKFWKNNNKDYLLIKYEDLIKDIGFELERIIDFIKKYIDVKTNEDKNENIIKTTNFKFLKDLEKKGYFNENAFERIEKSKLTELIVTDTIPEKKKSNKIKVLTCANLFADVMHSVNNNQSINPYFIK